MEEPLIAQTPPSTPRGSGGDADGGFERWLVRMEPGIRRFLGRLQPGDCDDLMQEVFARAWRSRARLDADTGTGESWLLKIAFRTFLDGRRSGHRTAADRLDDAMADGHPTPDAVAEARDWSECLLRQLRPIERAVLLGFHDRGLSIQALARESGVPEGTIKSHLHRARARLWELQQQEDQR